uniref:SHC adaptor protein 3 n=1 Tax=Laticauda laticaudata TaxID=8630 RepID=A0A8C5RYY9_LATLA
MCETRGAPPPTPPFRPLNAERRCLPAHLASAPLPLCPFFAHRRASCRLGGVGTINQWNSLPSEVVGGLPLGMQSLDELWMEEDSEVAEHPYYNSFPNKVDERVKIKIPSISDPSQVTLGKEQTYYQSQHIRDLCGEDRQQAPSRQGSLDIYSMPEGKSNVDPSKEMMPMYVNTQHINMETLHALQTEAENLPGKDLFDMSPFEDALKNQMPGPVLNKATSVECTSPLLSRACGEAVAEELSVEPWYQGEMTRKEAEHLLKKSGDFLVRKSTSNPGSYVLTGLQNGQAKHLLLVDPEGVIRTKDRTFDSIGHLIKHHLEYNLPIVSSGTELCLQQPAEKKQ